jgi:hypothetical protein
MGPLYCRAGCKAKRGRAIVLLSLLPTPCTADAGWDRFVRDVGLGWDNSFKIRWEELLRRRHDSELRNLLDGWSVASGFTQPLNSGGQPGAGGNGSRVSSSPTANLNLRYEPVQSWFASLTVYKYLDEKRRQPWNPDFSYSFGFDDYRLYTFGLIYSNYSNNRFSAKPGVKPTGFGYGTWSFSYTFPLPDVVAQPLLIDRSQTILCRVSYNLTPRYDSSVGAEGSWKQSGAFGCRYPVWGRLYMDATLYEYVAGKQQPWDPDYTYGFGYFDFRSGTLSLQYSNYSGTRFPWRKRSPGTGAFSDGQIGLTWNVKF